jgi:deazaflavin-dependent oxidoreductase (nitroreductase family)
VTDGDRAAVDVGLGGSRSRRSSRGAPTAEGPITPQQRKESGIHAKLLTTTGAKSGRPRLSPLVYLPIDGKTIIFGSYGGAPKNPAWVHNLRANPGAHIELGADSYDVYARELPPAERDEILPKVSAIVPAFAEYQSKTSRVFPLFEVTRA